MKRKIYKIFPTDKKLHNICRESFESKTVRCRTFQIPSSNAFYLQTENNMPKLKDLDFIEKEEEIDVKVGEVYRIQLRYCEHRHPPTGFILRLTPKDAVKKLCQTIGCENLGIECSFFIPSEKAHGHNIENCFHIKGAVKVEDVEKFEKALLSGVGTKGADGFGLIMFNKIE